MLLILTLMFSTLLIGYYWGKHDGRAEGYKRAAADIPILLRENSLEQGHCLLCKSRMFDA